MAVLGRVVANCAKLCTICTMAALVVYVGIGKRLIVLLQKQSEIRDLRGKMEWHGDLEGRASPRKKTSEQPLDG